MLLPVISTKLSFEGLGVDPFLVDSNCSFGLWTVCYRPDSQREFSGFGYTYSGSVYADTVIDEIGTSLRLTFRNNYDDRILEPGNFDILNFTLCGSKLLL